jgi:flavin reductase (DIM6/NTAB) family NADH-FMN oxidoreductase RutF
MSYYPTGVAVITSMTQGEPVGFVVGSFTSISLDPPLVGFFVATTSNTFSLIKEAGFFCCNVLSSDHGSLSAKFSSKTGDRFDGVDWRPAKTTSPILREAVAWLDCAHYDTYQVGDHYLVVGEVLDLRAARNVTPLVFHKGSYSTTGEQNDLAPVRETM